MADENTGSSLPEDQNSNPNSDDQGNSIPDWMQEAGWENSSGTVDESKPVFDDLDEEDLIVPAEIPAWLEDAAPEGFDLDTELSSDHDGDEDPDKLQSLIEDDLIPIAPTEEESTIPEVAKTVPIDIPEEVSDEPSGDVPSWLKNLELDEDSQETAVAWLENMPESLRATEEERQASLAGSANPEDAEDISDELEWMGDIFNNEEDKSISSDESAAELSEDLIAADLIPEQQVDDNLFAPEEIESIESEVPSWIDELGDEGDSPLPSNLELSEKAIPDDPGETLLEEPDEKIQSLPKSESGDSLMPDWLSEIDSDEDIPAEQLLPEDLEASPPAQTEEGEIPAWLGEFQDDVSTREEDDETDSLAWLESLAEKRGAPEEELLTTPEERAEAQAPDPAPIPIPESDSGSDVSTTDDTLNTEIPDWLSNIGDQEDQEETGEAIEEDLVENEFEASASWLDQIDDSPSTETETGSAAGEDSEVLQWLEGIEEPVSVEEDIEELLDEDSVPITPVSLEQSPDSIPEEDSQSDLLPDWLSELDSDNQGDASTLETAIRQSGHHLTEEEKDFLDRSEEEQEENADWLAKLDMVDDSLTAETDIPAIKVGIPEEEIPEEPIDKPEGVSVTGGILDRLKDPDEEISEPEIPQWLENLKNEEDPQETAILWLKQFVEQGKEANLQDEIKRYTDELDPGDSVPGWMEDLKNEEDPQTTAMLWLEKLSGEREQAQKPKPRKDGPDESGWLAELEKEATEQTQEPSDETPKDFNDPDEGWLADLDLDEKLKTSADDDIPDLTQSEDAEDMESQEGETPLWMKATSPLEGDFYTDELTGDVDKEVEIPEWLAGYTEGEKPEDSPEIEPETDPDTPPSEPASGQEEYAWVSTTDETKALREPIDLNKAAISQLESILGISYQVAIEILKPEVFIREVKETPKQKKKTTPVVQEEAPEKRLEKARSLLTDSNIKESL